MVQSQLSLFHVYELISGKCCKCLFVDITKYLVVVLNKCLNMGFHSKRVDICGKR